MAPAVLSCPVELTAESLDHMEADVARLLGPEGNRLVVDLGATTFVGSAGLGLLVKLGKRLHDRGGGIALARARPPVQKLLRIVGLGQILPHFNGLEQAVAHLDGPPR